MKPANRNQLGILQEFHGWKEGCLRAETESDGTIRSLTYHLSATYFLTIKADGGKLVLSVQGVPREYPD